MAKIAIVYFSGYGHTAKQAEAVRKGVDAVTDAVVTMYRIDESGELPFGALEELGQADAIIYGSPTYMGGPPMAVQKVRRCLVKSVVATELEKQACGGLHQLGFR